MAEEENEFEVVENEGAEPIEIEDISVEGQVSHYVLSRYRRSKDARLHDENRWLESYRNYRGEYGPDVVFEDNKSQVFIKITKTKVLAACAQINEVLFGNMTFPISVEATKLPEGVSESVHFTPGQPGQPPQPVTDEPSPEDMRLKPGETTEQYKVRLGGLKKKLAPIEGDLKEGPGTGPNDITFHPAAVSAKKMEKKIQDQLEESDASKELRYGSFECALFGTMVMKGPFAVDKEYANWDEEGNYNPTVKLVPQTSYVSIWNFYPDPDGRNVKDSEYTVERHRLSRSQIRSLKRRPYFDEDAIEEAVEYGENYQEEWWERELEEKNNDPVTERFEVLEFWGFIDSELVKDFGVSIPESLRDKDQLSVNIWVCNGKILRFVLNPFKPEYIPYYAVPYEVNPYSFFGIGVAENMDDTQDLMNTFMRLSVDNAALSGNLVFEVDEDALAPGENLEFYPGKVLRRQSGAPGQALFSHQFQNISAQNMQMFDVARRLSDEATGLPSFSHGQTGVQGIGRTASGISMLMSAANGSIRQVVKNFDDYLLGPIGKAFFHFNMQFDFDPEIRGDLEVKARGTESLMANEVRSQRLMQFLQVVGSNPMLAPFGKMEYIIREIAKSMDLDPEKVTNSLADAAIQAQLTQAMMPQDTSMQGGQGQGNMSVQDTSGGGGSMMGVGTAPAPGTQGFSGNEQG